MKRIACAMVFMAVCWAAPAFAYCGADHKGWSAAASELHIRVASLERDMTIAERYQAARDLALLESVIVGDAQLKALERLVLVGKKYRDRTIVSAAYELEGLVYHTVSEHDGSLAKAAGSSES